MTAHARWRRRSPAPSCWVVAAAATPRWSSKPELIALALEKFLRSAASRELLLAVGDPAAGQVVGGQLQLDAVAREDADAELAHLAEA